MDVYFFRHGFDAQRSGRDAPRPGRYLFTVEGRSLERDGNRLVPCGPSRHRVCVDGFEAEGPGSNIDPNVLSERLPWFLSFCNVGKRVLDLGADGQDVGRFPDVVKCGDVVIFGDPRWGKAIAIDTVLCASERVELPTHGGAFVLEERFDAYWKECVEKGLAEPILWEGFVRTPDFVLNLADSLPAPRRRLGPPDSPRAAALLGHRRQAWHPGSSATPHLQLVGTRCGVVEAASIEAVRAQFAAGRGFDFIPVRAGPRSQQALAAARPGVFIATSARAKDLRRQNVCRLPRTEGLALLDSIVGTADRLVHGQLRWNNPQRFSYFEVSQRPSKKDPTRQVDEYRPRYIRVPKDQAI